MGADPPQYGHRTDAGHGAHASHRGALRCGFHFPLLHRLRTFSPLPARARRRRGQRRAMGRGDHRRCSGDHPRACAPGRGGAQPHQLRLVAPARASRRAALFGRGRALGDARRHPLVGHDSWWRATAHHAAIVLPATAFLERNAIGGSSRDTFILAMHRAIDPVGDAKNDFDIFRALAQRLGYERAFTEDRDEMGWCQWVYDRVRTSATAKGVALPGFQQFWAEGFVELPPPERDYLLFQAFRPDPAPYALKTPSGRIEITSEAVAAFADADCPPHPTWMAPAEWLTSATAPRLPPPLLA